MVSLQYKGRIYKSKFSMRSIRYIVSDQAARAFPSLQRRWLLPLESRPISEAAVEDLAIPSPLIDAPIPECLTKLGVSLPQPLQIAQHFYGLRDTVVTGWAGAMIKNGDLLALHPGPNWTALVRARPHQMRTLPASRPYYNLMAPIPARGHIVHWLFESVVPLLTFLESGGRDLDLGLIVNAERSGFQQITIGYFKAKYGIDTLEPLRAGDAVQVPHLRAAVPVPYAPIALRPEAGMAKLEDLGRFIAGDTPENGFPKRIYVSRNDARLRRVLNEDRILHALEARGFQRVTLKGMPMAQQVQFFRQAEAVVGPHGAGLAHTAWCKPGTKVIEFFPGLGGNRVVKNAGTGMWLIAAQRGHHYSGYLAGPPESRDDSFTIPEALLLAALDAASIN
ncbi:MAG: glycosyltransferase family 61 protein [Rhodomicrobium sp.]